MGIYDRDYYRDERRAPLLANWSAVTILIIVNVALWGIDVFSEPLNGQIHWLDFHMALRPDLWRHPWDFWTLLSYGFAHDPSNIMHIGGNMFVLWVFGPEVERLYGREKFMKLYLGLVVSTGIAWVVLQYILRSHVPIIGASGAIMGIMVVYILNWPHRVFLLYFVLPVPAWVLGILYLGADFYGVVSPNPHDNTAHLAHVAGAVLGFLFVRTGWYLGALIPSRLPSWAKFNQPHLRVHSEHDDLPQTQREVQKRVDEILEKISREGEASLTPQERHELEDLSRRFRNRR
jgi:membrane associated rhomboid family serine protease